MISEILSSGIKYPTLSIQLKNGLGLLFHDNFLNIITCRYSIIQDEMC